VRLTSSRPGNSAKATWKSFQLHPDMRRSGGQSLERYLMERKGWSLAQIQATHARLAQTGAEAGLEYRFDKAVVADTFDAHRLIQAAQAEGKGTAMEDRLFLAYFSEGKDIADAKTLEALAAEIGIDPARAASVLGDKGAFADVVRADIEEAERLGVTGVPFFVFDRRFAVSGAQEVEVFRRALGQAS
jgi:predicted DsbA family dithiol-disulfide isomerase